MADPVDPSSINMADPVDPSSINMADPVDPSSINMADSVDPSSINMADPVPDTAAPPDGTFINSLPFQFTKVRIDEADGKKINTDDFLNAAESLTLLFDTLGSLAFTPVKKDMEGNIKKIRQRLLVAPLDSETLQSLVRGELDTKKHTATEGLVWLTRGLDFTQQSLSHSLDNTSAELSASFREGYSKTLAKHHTFLMKPLFMAAMSATPYRADFYAKLGPDLAVVQEQLREWLAALKNIVDILNEFLAMKENKW